MSISLRNDGFMLIRLLIGLKLNFQINSENECQKHLSDLINVSFFLSILFLKGAHNN